MDTNTPRAIVAFLLRPAVYGVFMFVLTIASAYGQVIINTNFSSTLPLIGGPQQILVRQICLFVALLCGGVWILTTWSAVSFLVAISAVLISFTSLDADWRLFGSLLGTLWVSICTYLVGAEVAAGVGGAYAAPGGATVTDVAPALKQVGKAAAEAAFWVGFATLAIGLCGSFAPYQAAMIVLALLVVVVSGTLATEDSHAFEYVYPPTVAVLWIAITLGLYVGFANLGYTPKPDQLWIEAQRIFRQSFAETVLGYIIFAALLIAFGKINKRSAILQTGAWMVMLVPLTWLYVGGGLAVLLGLPAQAQAWSSGWWKGVSVSKQTSGLRFLLDPAWYQKHPAWGTLIGAGVAGALAGGFNRSKIFGFYVVVAAVGWSVYYLHLAKVF